MEELDVLNPLQSIKLLLTEEQITEIIEWFDANSKPSVIIEEEPPVDAISIEKMIEYMELKKLNHYLSPIK